MFLWPFALGSLNTTSTSSSDDGRSYFFAAFCGGILRTPGEAPRWPTVVGCRGFGCGEKAGSCTPRRSVTLIKCMFVQWHRHRYPHHHHHHLLQAFEGMWQRATELLGFVTFVTASGMSLKLRRRDLTMLYKQRPHHGWMWVRSLANKKEEQPLGP